MTDSERLAGALLTTRGGSPWDELAKLAPADAAALVRALKAEVDRRMRSEPPSALAAADVLCRVAERTGAELALALRGRANALHYNARWGEARGDYERAAELYEAGGDELEAARTRRNLVEVLQYLGECDGALECADRARPVLEAEGTLGDVARLANNVGNVYTRLDEYPAAREHYQRARTAFVELDDALARSITDFNLAVVEMNANQLEEARDRLVDARAGFAAAGMQVHVADCDYSLAYLESRLGRFAEAIRGLERARALYLENGKPSGPPLCDLDLAEIFLRLDARQNAREYAERATRGFEELGLAYEAARAQILWGLALVKLGASAEAVDRLEQAARRFRELGNEASAAVVEVQRASVEIEEGAPERARGRLLEARRELALRELRFLSDLAGVHLARAHLALGEPQHARALLEELLAAPAGSRAVFDLLLEADAEVLLSQALRGSGHDEAATESLRRAVEAIERNYAEIPTSDVRISFFGERHLAYVDLVWDLAEQGDATEAVGLLDRSRARSLNELDGVRGEGSAAFRRARERLDWLLSRRLDREVGPATTDHDLRTGALDDAEIRRAQDELLRLARREARPAAPVRFDPDLLARARGSEGDVLLVYLVSPRGVRLFLVDDDGIADLVLATDERELKVLRDRLWLHVDKLRLGREYVSARRERLERQVDPILTRFGELLVEPVLDRVAGRPLVVVPYGVLHDVPFHAFLVGGRPLVDASEVSYAFSLSSLARARETTYGGRGELLACGVAAGSLRHIDDEIDALEGLYGEALARVGPDELVRRLETRADAGGVLHVAAHSIFQPRRPVFSAVCLGERFLLAHDLERMHMGFDLVVLSGCETGRKRRVPGEELFGLSRALLGAGARATLGSLWAVDDADALSFMRTFHQELAAGRTSRAAVARAQRLHRDRGLHPSCWASFALVGAPDVRFPARPELPVAQETAS